MAQGDPDWRVPPAADAPSRAFAVCWGCASTGCGGIELNEALRRSSTSRAGLFLPPPRSSCRLTSSLSAEGLRERLLEAIFPRGRMRLLRAGKQDRAHERHLLLYLQRVCAKNDSLSEFGPEGWGTIEGEPRLKLAPQPGIAERETFLERWTAHGVAAALNADPEIRLELSPRLHPNGRIDGDQFVFADTGETPARSGNARNSPPL